MREMLGVAIEAAKEAGKILKENLGKSIEIGFKGEINLVTDIDITSEKTIVHIIRNKYPDHQILTEEGEGHKGTPSHKWIIDPLDGTTNYAHGYPCFCVSIAFEKNGNILFGVIYDPVLDELFTAEKGGGACLNGRKIRASSTDKLIHSMLATGFPYDLRESQNNNLIHFNNFTMSAQAIRRAGSAALDLCYVAMGRFDGFWELKLSPWDVAAGSLIVREAGGMVSDFKGGVFDIYSKEILASNGKIHYEMVEVLKREVV
ncbi:MAG: inositol monophosphatase [Deltaproteobacteria bacterium]|jgi:myo-inositol-1(or 4)-monophosphatase|nr:MAG: inositol monophosphatase [Deltaproteobacteria bacterium]